MTRRLPLDVGLLWRYARIIGPSEFFPTMIDFLQRPEKKPWYPMLIGYISGRKCLEVGGPSPIFAKGGRIPLYHAIGLLDNVDYTLTTLWSQQRSPPDTWPWSGHPSGGTYIAEATNLGAIPPCSYGVVLSSHVLEHIANPLRALGEWKRVLEAAGKLVLVVPEGARTFDHRRHPTSLAHFWDDYAGGTSEADLRHLPEVLAKHDLAMDRPAGTWEEFQRRSAKNEAYRALHHHVFTMESTSALLSMAGFRVEILHRVAPFHLLALATKTEEPGTDSPRLP
jgi:SAM-dependent methyltransferase